MYDHRPPLGLQFYLRILLYFSNILRLPRSTKAVSYLLCFLNMSNFPPLRSLLEMPSRHSLWRTQDSCTGTSSLSQPNGKPEAPPPLSLLTRDDVPLPGKGQLYTSRGVVSRS